MAIHKVLSSASIMRLVEPGCPSLMATGAEGVLLARLTTVRCPPKRVSPFTVRGSWPTTYMVLVSTRALLAPPGIATVVMAVVSELTQGAELQGSRPEVLPRVKINGATGSTEYDDATPPHSG